MSFEQVANQKLIIRLHSRLGQARRFSRGLTRPGRRAFRPGRWQNWVQAQLDRYQARPGSSGRLRMLLASPPGSPPGIFPGWTFSPVFHLNINPVVRQYLARQAQPEGRASAFAGTGTPHSDRQTSSGPTPVRASARVYRAAANQPPLEERTPNTAARMPAQASARSARTLPMQRVFLRQEITEEQPGMVTIQVQQVGQLAASASTAERVTLDLRRVEEPTRARSAANPAQNAPAAPARKVVRANPRQPQPAQEKVVEANWVQPGGIRSQARREAQAIVPPAAPAINIQQITDQVVQLIDRRILAHRERTGKLF